MNYKILIFGKGFIGSRLQAALQCAISDRRIHSFEDAQGEIDRHKPGLIVNCIGHTGLHSVDDCELDKDRVIVANSFVPLILAEVARRNSLRFVHISSGCIYHYDYAKNIPIDEDAPPDFFDLYYSRTKIYAEQALSLLARKQPILMARIRIPLDAIPHPRNILTKLIGYRKVIDIPNSITYIPDFLDALKHLIGIGATGIYNVVNKDGLRYPELLDAYQRYIPDFKYEIIDYHKFISVRTNLILSTQKLEQTGFKVRDIREVLDECIRNYIKY